MNTQKNEQIKEEAEHWVNHKLAGEKLNELIHELWDLSIDYEFPEETDDKFILAGEIARLLSKIPT